jgi:hypothetical protein
LGVEDGREKDAQDLMARCIKHDTAIVLYLQDCARMAIGARGPDGDVARGPEPEVAVALHLEDELAVRRRDLRSMPEFPP